MLTLKDISTQYGLPEKFLRRCVASMKDELDPFLTRGDRNAMLFKTASSGIFEQIKIFKNEGVSIPEIVKAIKKNLASHQTNIQPKTLGGKVGQTPEMLGKEIVKSPETLGRKVGQTPVTLDGVIIETPEMLGKNNNLELLFERILEITNDKNKVELDKKDLEYRLKRNEDQMKLLTNGSTDINMYINNNAEITAKRKLIIEQLKNTSFWMFRKRKSLLSNLEDLLV